MTYDFYKAEGRLFEGEYAAIPEDMRESMTRYVEERKEPGGFLSAVIRNDLLDAVCRADRHNLLLVKEYAQWFYNVAPAGCHGSPEKMKAWLGGGQ
jgi:hypothetical protein